MPTVVAALIFVLLTTMPIAVRWNAASARSQGPPPGITRTALIENDTVMMARLRMAPGAKEDVHTHPFSAVVIHLDAGDVDMRLGDARTTSRRPAGFVEFIATPVPHAAANVGNAPFDLVTIAIKPDRKRGGEQAAQPPPAGIIRSPVLENSEARVARVEFAPQAREPVHSHPFDLVVVPLTAGRLEVRVGERVETRDYAPGAPVFLPRDVPHALSNVGGTPVTVFSVGIKLGSRVGLFIGVAVALRQLGSLMLRSGRLDEARAHTDEGRAIMAAVVAGDPTNRWAVDDYATLVAVGEKRSACRPRPRQSAESCEDTLSRVKECEARAPNQCRVLPSNDPGVSIHHVADIFSGASDNSDSGSTG